MPKIAHLINKGQCVFKNCHQGFVKTNVVKETKGCYSKGSEVVISGAKRLILKRVTGWREGE